MYPRKVTRVARHPRAARFAVDRFDVAKACCKLLRELRRCGRSVSVTTALFTMRSRLAVGSPNLGVYQHRRCVDEFASQTIGSKRHGMAVGAVNH